MTKKMGVKLAVRTKRETKKNLIQNKISDADIRRAITVLRQGGVIALPTETTYGLACDPRDADAVKEIFLIKGRMESKSLQLIAGSLSQVTKLASMSAAEKHLAQKHWPGPLTMLVRLRAGKKLAKHVSPKGIIGIRVTSGDVAKRVALAFGHPIAATSANRSGKPPAFSGMGVQRAFRTFDHVPALLLDSGMLPRRKPSTVARIKKNGEVEILRQGTVRL